MRNKMWYTPFGARRCAALLAVIMLIMGTLPAAYASPATETPGETAAVDLGNDAGAVPDVGMDADIPDAPLAPEAADNTTATTNTIIALENVPLATAATTTTGGVLYSTFADDGAAAAAPPVRPYADVFDKRADADSSNLFGRLSASTFENGRVWMDKTVSADRAVIYDEIGKESDSIPSIPAEPDEFLVTLSALSQSYNIEAVVEPSDTVFVIDISSSMTTNFVDEAREVSRARAMVGALNNAIKALMDANTNNRIAVVAFGGGPAAGQSRIVKILRLDHYTISDGQYFALPSGGTITVSSEIPASALYEDASTRRITVKGGTSTQRGIYEGARVLLDNADTEFTTVADGRAVTLTRKPNIVLLSDGGTTIGWTDYRFENPISNTSDGSDSGNANNANIGMDILTVMTAAYCKQLVRDHYYDTPDTDDAAGFYTIGLGVGNDVDAQAVLDPKGNSDEVAETYNGTTYKVSDVLDAFVSGSPVSFPKSDKGQSKSSTLYGGATNIGPGGEPNYIKSYDYTDAYYQTERADELAAAFASITQRIGSTGNYITKTDTQDAGADFSGYVVFSDVLGKYTEVKGVEGLYYDGRHYNGANFAEKMDSPNIEDAIDEYVEIMTISQDYYGHDPSDPVEAAQAAATSEDMIRGSLKAGDINEPDGLYYNGPTDFSNKIMYYADEHRNLIKGYFDSYTGKPNPVPTNATCLVEQYTGSDTVKDTATGAETDLMLVSFQVVTVLKDGYLFEAYLDTGDVAREFQKGMQLARLYVPSSLIPQRAVTPRYDALYNTHVEAVNVKESAPVRFVYSVGLREDEDFSLAGMDPDYKSQNQVSGENAYYFYANEWYGPSRGRTDNVPIAYFQPGENNPYYYFTRADADESGNVPLFVQSGGGYAQATSYDQNTRYYWLSRYLDRNAAGTQYLAERYVEIDGSITAADMIISDERGYQYVKVGAPKQSVYGGEMKEDTGNETGNYTGNRTETFPLLYGEYNAPGDGGLLRMAMLFNNGRLKVPYTSVPIVKNWSPNISGNPAYVQLYANGEEIGDYATILADKHTLESGAEVYYKERTFNELPLYEFGTDNGDSNAKFIQYTVREGDLDENGDFSPYGNDNPPTGEFNSGGKYPDLDGNDVEIMVSEAQPVWSNTERAWFNANINNLEIVSNIMWVLLEKRFAGIDPSELAPGELTFEWLMRNADGPPALNEFPFKDSNPDNDLYPGNAFILSFDEVTAAGGASIFEKYIERVGFDITPGFVVMDAAGNTITEGVTSGIIPEHDGTVLAGVNMPYMPGHIVYVRLTNTYKPVVPAKLTLTKTFSGLSEDEEYPTDIMFNIVGTNGDTEVYDESFYYHDNRFVNSVTKEVSTPNLTLNDLRPGTYTITETGGMVAGYDRTLTASGSSASVSGNVVSADVTYGDNTVALTNSYTEQGDLIITKRVDAPAGFTVPDDIMFHVSGNSTAGERVNYYISYNDEESGSGIEFTPDVDGARQWRITDIPPGTFTVTEEGGAALGYEYKRTPESGTATVTIDGPAEQTVEFTNTYTKKENPDPPKLILKKRVYGIESSDYPQSRNFTLTVTGVNDKDEIIYEEAFGGDKFGVDANGYYELVVPGPIPEGIYSVTEQKGDADVTGRKYEVNHTDGYKDLSMVPEDEETVIFANNYSLIPPAGQSDPSPSRITISKSFTGIYGSRVADIAFTVVGKDADGAVFFDKTVKYADFVNGKYILDNMTAGTYTVTESGGELSGYSMVVQPSYMQVVGLGEGDDAAVAFVNKYTANPTHDGGGHYVPPIPAMSPTPSPTPIKPSPSPTPTPTPTPTPRPRSDGGTGGDGPILPNGGRYIGDHFVVTSGLFNPNHVWYIRGYTDDTLRPERTITRAEVAMAFFRLLDPAKRAVDPASRTVDGAPQPWFTDVKADDWYGLAIDTLAYYGVVNGDPDGGYRPNDTITRAELAAIVSRFEHLEAAQHSPYTDVGEDHWAYRYILSATQKGWFVVDTEGRFRPDEHLIRAEFVTVVNRVMNRHIRLEDIPEEGIHKFIDFDTSHWSYAAFIESNYTHDFTRLPDGQFEEWTAITDDGLTDAYNQ